MTMAPDYRIVSVDDEFELQVWAPFGWASPYEPQDTREKCERMYERIGEGERP
jgi:hypothetical protein